MAADIPGIDARDVLDLIGNTPLLRVNVSARPNGNGDGGGSPTSAEEPSTPLFRLGTGRSSGMGSVLGKAEFLNPGGSVKDRPALAMIDAAMKSGELPEGGTIVEATSGNTGIGLALVGARRGLRVILVMPENMSEERKKIMAALGGEVILTPAAESLDGCLRKAEEVKREIPHAWMCNQFGNPANVAAHYTGTGPEIWKQTAGRVDSFVSGVGSGGTLAGVGKFLKEMNPRVRIVAVEPKDVSALLGHEPGLHRIQGIGDGFVPAVVDRSIINHVVEVTDDEAISTARWLAKKEGLCVGTSSGACVLAAAREAAFLGPGSNVVTILADRAERYFSTSLI